jgi:uncharacterized RDD family membrane protein YckC
LSDEERDPTTENSEIVEKTDDTLYCDNCGSGIESGDGYCPKCGKQTVSDVSQGYIELATWTQRFIALVIDGLLLGVALAVLNLPGYQMIGGVNITLGIDNVLQFLYYMFMDQYYGQSIGKKVMNLRITKIGGAPLSLADAAIESFGKVFLLPLDFIIGFFFYKSKNQRLFNYLSDTVVIREE